MNPGEVNSHFSQNLRQACAVTLDNPNNIWKTGVIDKQAGIPTQPPKLKQFFEHKTCNTKSNKIFACNSVSESGKAQVPEHKLKDQEHGTLTYSMLQGEGTDNN